MTSDFIQAAAADGLQINKIETGTLARCKVKGDRGGKKSGAYRYFDDENPGGIWWNWKTGARGTWTARQEMTDSERAAHQSRIRQAERERKAEQQRNWETNLTRNCQLISVSSEITTGDPVDLYLQSRRLTIPQHPHGLRYAPALPYFNDGKHFGDFPAMLAAVTGSDGRLVNVHRTYLTPNGAKARVPCSKKLMPASGATAGSAVRIGQPLRQSHGVALAVAEGIETALSVTALHGLPCWAAVSANGLKTFQWPREVTSLFICGDNDENNVGQEAAQALAQRAAREGITARVCIPPATGTDWADVLAATTN